MKQTATEYQRDGQPSAARVCHATLMKIIAFEGKDTMSFHKLTIHWLQSFEYFLKDGLADNSVSTYLRMLQAVYNKAVYERKVDLTAHLFKKVYKGRMPSRSRALALKEFRTLAHSDEKPPQSLIGTRDLFLLMFYLRGIAFVDLAYLRRCNLHGNLLIYRRHKTGKLITVQIVPEAMKIIEHYQSLNPDSPYLFSFLTPGNKDEYSQYEAALRDFNTHLKHLGVFLGLSIPLTSYCARHTWASFANFCSPDKKLISEGMGHSSVQVTEIYFQAYEAEEIGKLNQGVIAYAIFGKRKIKKTS